MATWTDLAAVVAGRWTVADQEEFRGNFKVIGDAWTSYTPAWTASTTNPTIGNGTLAGRAIKAGKLVIGTASITFGSTTTVGSGVYALSTPSTMLNFRALGGSATLFDTSAAGIFPRVLMGVNTTSFGIADFVPNRVSNSSPITWATGDRIDTWFCYEAA